MNIQRTKSNRIVIDKHAYILRLCLFIYLFLSPLHLHAQQKGDTITNKTHEIPGVTIKARRASQKVSAATPTQIITKDNIEHLGLQNMADAVRHFTGANVKDYGGVGGLKTVSIRNLGAAHTAISYDGIAVSNCQAGQIDIGRFSLDNVALLSLAIGQGDNLLQPARLYASAGVLNIETEVPLFTGKYSFQGRIKGGSYGMVNPSLRWAQRLGKQTTLTMDGNFLRADGIYDFTLENGKYTTKERRYNSDINSWHGEANLFHTFKDSSALSIKTYYFDSERGLPGVVLLYNPNSYERLWDKNFFTQVKYKKQFSPQWVLQAQGKYNYSKNKYQDEGAQYEGGITTEHYRQNEYYLSATIVYSPTKEFSLALAQDGAINTLWNNLQFCPYPTRYTSLTAFSAKYQTGQFTAMASLVGTYLTENVESGERPEDMSKLSPSASISFRPWKDRLFYIRAMYKSTFRTPTFNDLYYYRLGNRSLRPEKAQEYNVGITWSGSPCSWINNISVTLDGYYNHVKDKIVAFPSTYVWRMANYGKAHISGVDFTFSTFIPIIPQIDLRIAGGYTWQKAIDVTDSSTSNYKDQLPYTPEHSGNGNIIVETPWVNVGYSVVGVGKRYYLSQNIPDYKIDGYTDHTLSVSHAFKFNKYTLTLQAEVINLLNKQYEVIKYYPMPGRNWQVSGTIQF